MNPMTVERKRRAGKAIHKADSPKATPEVIAIEVSGYAQRPSGYVSYVNTDPKAEVYAVHQVIKGSGLRYRHRLIATAKTLPGVFLAARTQAEKVNVPVWDLSGRTIPPETIP